MTYESSIQLTIFFFACSRFDIVSTPLSLAACTVTLCRQVEGAKFAHQLQGTRAMRALNARINPNKFPACENFTFPSDEYWACQVSARRRAQVARAERAGDRLRVDLGGVVQGTPL